VKAEPEVAQPMAPSTDAPPPANGSGAPQHDFDDEAKPFDPSAEDMEGVKQEYNTGYNSYDAQEAKQPVRLKDDG